MDIRLIAQTITFPFSQFEYLNTTSDTTEPWHFKVKPAPFAVTCSSVKSMQNLLMLQKQLLASDKMMMTHAGEIGR